MSQDAHSPLNTDLNAAPPASEADQQGAHGGGPEGALDVLNDLEARLSKLKQWQANNDRQVTAVREQADELAERESQVQRERQDIDTARQQLDQDRQALAEDRSAIAQEREALDQASATTQRDREALDQRTGDLDSRSEDLEQQRQALDARRAALDEQVATADARVSGLDQRDAELSTRETDLERLRSELDVERAEFDRVQQEVAARADEIDTIQSSFDATRTELETLRSSLDTDRQGLAEDRETFDAQRQLLRERKEELKKVQMELRMRSDALDAQQASLEQSRDALLESAQNGHACDDTLTGGIVLDPDLSEGGNPARRQEDRLEAKRRTAELDERREELDRLQADLDRQRAELDERELTLDSLGSAEDMHALEQSLAQRETAIKDKEDQLRSKFDAAKQNLASERDRMADENIALEALARDLDIQRNALAEERERLLETGREISAQGTNLDASASTDPGTPDDSSQTVQGLTLNANDAAALDHIAGPDDQDTANTLLAQAQAQIAQADARAAELDTLAATLNQRHSDLEQQLSDLEERQSTLKTAEAELGDRRADSGSSLNAMDLEDYARELRERSETLTQREADVIAREESLAAGLGDPGPASGSGSADEVAALRAELDEVRENYEKRKAQMMKADQVIKQRRQKIRRYLGQLREQSAALQEAQAKAAASTGQAAGLERERRTLIEVKDFLEASESHMIRRWSAFRASNVAAVVILAAAAAAASSYFAAQHLVSPVWQGTMAMAFKDTANPDVAAAEREALEAGLPAGPVVEPGVDALQSPAEPPATTPREWIKAFKQRMLSKDVMQATLDNLDANLPERLFKSPTALASHLVFALQITGNPEHLVFTYSTTDRGHADDLLQHFAHAIVGDQMTRNGRKPAMLQEAKRSSQPFRDDTNTYIVAIFLAQVVVGLLLVLPLWLFFRRATPVMYPGAGGAPMAVLAKPIDAHSYN